MAAGWTTVEHRRVADGYERGETAPQIAIDLPGRSSRAVHQYAYRAGLRSSATDLQLAIDRWQRQRGTTVVEYCRWASGRLSKRETAGDIGISLRSLREHIAERDPDLWRDWPRTTPAFLRAMADRRTA